MLVLKGSVANIWDKPASLNPDGSERAPSQKRVQLMSTDVNGKMELEEIRLHDLSDWNGLDGKHIEIEVKVYNIAGENGGGASVGLYAPKGAKPIEVPKLTAKK